MERVILMAKQLLQQCLDCKAWTLATTCPSCGAKAQAAAPLKWSPEDHRADIRRKMYNVEDPAWAKALAYVTFTRRDESNSTRCRRRRVMRFTQPALRIQL